MIVLVVLLALLNVAPASASIYGNGPPGAPASTAVTDDMSGSGPPG